MLTEKLFLRLICTGCGWTGNRFDLKLYDENLMVCPVCSKSHIYLIERLNHADV